MTASPPRLTARAETTWLDCASGERRVVPVDRWLGVAAGADEVMLDACVGATVDVGCGPGRMAAALTHRGVPTLGVDTSGTAVRLTRARGAAAIRRDVFDPLPGEGRWRHALLADGNLGIGGDPITLLRRLARLLGRHGTVLVETEPPGVGLRSDRVRVVRHEAGPGPWFGWTWVGVDALEQVAGKAGLRVHWCREHLGRWFAELGHDRER